MTHDIQQDLEIVEAMTEALPQYLKGKDLYGLLRQDMPRQTIGGMLLRLQQLRGLSLTAEQQQRLQAATQRMEQERDAWRVHYEEKLARELKSRMGSLMTFAKEQSENSARESESFPVEAMHRTVIELLKQEAQALGVWNEELGAELHALDRRLQPVLKRSAQHNKFFWDEALQPLYPEADYWWLYSDYSA